MLRLSATEIALTPADVEETRQRMERRRAANPPAASASRSRARGPPIPPPHCARLHRGAQRSRDSAVATLGNIPILRPQEAVFDSSDDVEDGQAVNAESSNVGSSNEGSQSTGEELSTSFSDSEQSHRTLQLPFRPAPRAATSEDTAVKTQPSPSRFGRERTNSEDDDGASLQAHMHASTDGLIEPADTIETPMRNRAHSLRQHGNHIPSPLQQMHIVSSPHQRQDQTPTNSSQGHQLTSAGRSSEVSMRRGHATPISQLPDDDDESPTIFLHGYFDINSRYTFRQSLPRTEPRPRTQPVHRARAMSSSSEPSRPIRVHHPDSSGASTDDPFWSPPAPGPPTEVMDATSSQSSESHYWTPLGSDGAALNVGRETSQRIGSEASTSSLAYSFYELPDSRHSSSVYSQTDLGQAQFDGAAASRQASRGAYHSIRLPHQHHATSGVHSQTLSPSRTPSSSTPDLAVTQHGFSPVPTNPYTRGPNGQYAFRPLITQDNLLGGEQDAVEAITRELSSPLELVEERATSYLQRVSAQRQIQQAQATGYTTFQHQISEVEAHSDRYRHTLVPGSGSSTQRYSNYGYSSAGTHYQPRYTVPRPHSQHHPYGQRPFNAGEQPVHTLGPPARRRAAPTARAGQRSSENAPVNSSFNLTTTLTRDARPHTHATSNLPAPTQRTSLVPRPNPPGMRSNGAPGRVSHAPMLYPPRPRDISNRPHPAVLPPDDDTGSSDGLTPTETYARPGGMGRGPRIPPRYASRGSGITYTHPHANPNRIITPTPTPLPHQHAQTPTFFNHPPSRGPPSTSTTLDIASGITSRGRPAIPMSVVGPASAAMSRPLIQAPTIRRVHISQRPHRRELENSADSEIGVVEGGSSAVTRRFDDVDSGVGGEGGDEMTETSPGLGKFERRVNG